MKLLKPSLAFLSLLLCACSSENATQESHKNINKTPEISSEAVEVFNNFPATFADWNRAETAKYWSELTTSGYSKREATGVNFHISEVRHTKAALGEIDYSNFTETVAGQKLRRERFSKRAGRKHHDIKALGTIAVFRGNYLRKREWLSYFSIILPDDDFNVFALETSEIELNVTHTNPDSTEQLSTQAYTFRGRNDYGQRAYINTDSTTIAVLDQQNTGQFEMKDNECFKALSAAKKYTLASDICEEDDWYFDTQDRLRLYYLDPMDIETIKAFETLPASEYSFKETKAGIPFAVRTLMKKGREDNVRTEHLWRH